MSSLISLAPGMSYRQISDLQSHLRKKVEGLDGKILQMESDLREARLERDNMQHTLNTLINYNAPVSKLPNEVLAKIFWHCVDADTSGHILSGRAVPWVLAQICCRWRDVTVSNPRLWNAIRVDTKYMCRNPLQVVETWIKRSRPLPFSCMVIFSSDNRDRETDETAIFDILSESCERWEHLYIRFRFRIDLCDKLLTKHHFAPRLQSIQISTLLLNRQFFTDDGPEILGLTAPWVKDASISVTIPLERSIAHPSPHIPIWPQLQTLEWTLRGPSHEFLHTISAMSHLRSLSLRITEEMSWGTCIDIFTLGSLRRLEFSGDLVSVGQLMELLRVPHLTDLSIVDSPPETQSSLQPLTNMVRRSSCRLERLNTSYKSYGALAHPDTASLITQLSTLRELHIRTPLGDGLDGASQFLRNTSIFPQLRALHLVILGSAPDFNSTEQLLSRVVSVVKARRQSDSPDSQLSTLSIDTKTYLDLPKHTLDATPPSFKQLLGLQKEGLHLIGSVVKGSWVPARPFSTEWGFQEDELRRSRFGFPDQLNTLI